MVRRFQTRDHLRPEVATEYAVDWCPICDFGRIAGQFTAPEVASFYAPGYYTHLADAAEDRRASLFHRLRLHLAWKADNGVVLSPAEIPASHPAATLCDVGCGGGHAMALFRKAGYDVVGVEPDPCARALASNVGEVFDGTAEALPAELQNRKFSVVLLSHVLEHCIDPTLALGAIRSLLAPGGTAIFEVPNNGARGFRMYGPGWFFADVPRHLQFFTERSLRKAMTAAGFRVTRVIYTGYSRQFSPQWLASQQSIRECTGEDTGASWRSNSWRLLASTAFASPAEKYDSIRIHAVHAAEAFPGVETSRTITPAAA